MTLDFIGDFTICILITHIYRNFVLRNNWHKLRLKNLVPRIIPMVALLGASFMLLIAAKLYIVRSLSVDAFTLSFWIFFKSIWLTLLVTGLRLMSIWVLAYHLYHYAQREINIARENAQLSIIAREAKWINLSAQLNPHFFFNSLNNIKFLVAENPDAARRAIDLLSDLLRNSLYSKDDRLIQLEEEISLVSDYLELEKMRLEERLVIEIKAEESLSAALIPPLSIQALVENAIKHGIDKTKEGGIINVFVERNNGFIRVNVQNPGMLNGTHEHQGLGLKNLKERLNLQYDGKASLQVSEVPGGKVSATLIIPFA